MKILLIEDDVSIASFVRSGLKQAGYAIDSVTTGTNGLNRMLSQNYDAAIVDIMLPEMDGLTVIERVRNANILTPVIVLSAKSSVDDRIRGLETGCDDYLIKPFAFSELLARIQALIRRSQNLLLPETTLSVADLTIDLKRRKVFRGKTPIDLQPLEYNLLEYLMQNTGRIVSKTMIVEHVWEYNFDPQTNVVEARICRLRDKVDRPFERALIHTIRGAGYVLE